MLGRVGCARARVARALTRERRVPGGCFTQRGCWGRSWTLRGRLEPSGSVVPFSAAPCSASRAQFWHATACWRALGHFRRVPHILGVAGSLSSRCVLVRALAGQGGHGLLVLPVLICGTNWSFCHLCFELGRGQLTGCLGWSEALIQQV